MSASMPSTVAPVGVVSTTTPAARVAQKMQRVEEFYGVNTEQLRVLHERIDSIDGTTSKLSFKKRKNLTRAVTNRKNLMNENRRFAVLLKDEMEATDADGYVDQIRNLAAMITAIDESVVQLDEMMQKIQRHKTKGVLDTPVSVE